MLQKLIPYGGLIFLFLQFDNTMEQTAFQNFGNVQIHQEGQIGFHIDLVNNGAFNKILDSQGFIMRPGLYIYPEQKSRDSMILK